MWGNGLNQFYLSALHKGNDYDKFGNTKSSNVKVSSVIISINVEEVYEKLVAWVVEIPVILRM